MAGLKATGRNKLGNDALDNVNQMVHKWNNRLTLDNLRLTERYVEGDIELILHLLGDPSGNSTDYCAVLRYDPTARLAGDAKGNRSGLRRTRTENNVRVGCSIEQDKQETMFAEVVKCLESPE